MRIFTCSWASEPKPLNRLRERLERSMRKLAVLSDKISGSELVNPSSASNWPIRSMSHCDKCDYYLREHLSQVVEILTILKPPSNN